MLSIIVQAQENGHNVCICNLVEATGKFVFCNRGGSYAQVRDEGLLRRCKATSGGQRQRLVNWVQQGKHPTSGARLGKPRLVPICTESPKDTGRSSHKAKLVEEWKKRTRVKAPREAQNPYLTLNRSRSHLRHLKATLKSHHWTWTTTWKSQYT